MSFERDMQAAVEKAEKAATAAVRATALQLFTSVIERTPVATGRARGNWRTSTLAPAQGIIERTDGNAAINEVNLKTATFRLADTIYLSNNLPYIERLEDGYSTQAPTGMVQVSVDAFERAIAQNAARHRI